MSRRKVTIQARELSDMDIKKISLVKRGANRIPFRITKSSEENSMLNISNLFLQKKEKVAPMVVGIVLAKADDSKLYTEALANQDLTVDRVVTKDDQTVLMVSKDELDTMENITVIKVNDEAAVLVVNVEKGLLTFPDSLDFDENITKSSFFPSYRLATDILSDTLGNIVYSEGDMAVTKSAITKALDDFNGYLDAVLNTIPVSAFKAEEAIVATQKGMLINEGGETVADDKAEAAETETDTAATDDADAKKDDVADTESADAKDAEAGTGDAATGDADTANAEDADVNKEEKDSTDSEVMTALSVITKSIGSLTTAIEAVKSDVAGVKDDFNSQVDDLKSSIKKTDEAITGTVHSDVSEDDSSDNVDTKKSDGNLSWDGVLDFGDGVEVS